MGWQPGQSGNPAGRKPEADVTAVREYAKKYCTEAIDGLLAVARDPKTSDLAKVAARCCPRSSEKGCTCSRDMPELNGPDAREIT